MKPNKENRQESRSTEATANQSSQAAGNGAAEPQQTKSPVQFPSLSLPKGGGAIQGIGEKFQANPVTGTGSMSVPLALSPGRGGFAPQLALSYDSGAGNGAFGLGWDVGLPSISRKTQKGLPQYDGLPKYQDATDHDSDVFLLSGAEDLVPVLKNGAWDWKTAGDFRVYPYRPRTEGLFAQIEKWVRLTDGDTHWRATTKDNLTSIYGPDADSRIADPGAPNKVFTWLLERSHDHKGNVICYQYKKEDGAGLAKTIFEKNRHNYSQQHLKRVLYGNTQPYFSPSNEPLSPLPADNTWLFELVFDYGEHDTVNGLPQYAESMTLPGRQDAFSSYRAGFEIRDYRLCRRMLMFHRFAELGPEPYLVKATLLEYDENPIATQLNSITHAGYLSENGATTVKTSPPVTFRYTEQKIDHTIYTIAAEDLPNAPEGIDGKRYQWADLEGEGLSGLFTQTNETWYFKRNLGDGHFGPKETIRQRPVPAGAGVSDYDGNGLNDYGLQNGSLNGFFEMNDEGEWQPFRSFTDIPNINWNDPNLRSIDVNGDGMADLLITENDCFVWFPSKAKDGFQSARRVAKAIDEEQGPRIVFQEAFQTIFLADLSGSGMTDICRIRNGEICYWPNLGYGRFGAKVAMANSPRFDNPEAFDPARLRLTDIDGAGPTDIIYLGNGQLHYWINQSGNGWSERKSVPGFPLSTSLHSVQAMDLFGNGTSCIVWSSPLPGETHAPLRYIQLMGKTETEGNKPYLLKEVDNNMGAVTRLKYEASTRFYLDDRRAGRPWITKLPFPVQVLTRQEVYDAISDTHFVSKYAYHHGYFDPVEREFRGFGMVEQWDTERYDAFEDGGLFEAKGGNWSEASHIPPIHTKTWFHNGYYRQGGKITRQYESEYYAGDSEAWLLEDTILPNGLLHDETREAARALKGRPLRVEVYALDGNPHPYSVTESNYQIKVLQRRGLNRHAVFFAAENESLAYQYERDPADPRIAHSFALAIDDYGNPTRSLALVYPRRAATLFPEQQRLYCTYTEAEFINKADAADFYRVGVPYQQKLYEITGWNFLGKKLERQDIDAFLSAADLAEVPYETPVDFSQKTKRLVQFAKTTFYNADLSGELPEGEIAHHGLPYKAWDAAYTDAQLQGWYGDKLPADAMIAGGFIFEDGYWWRPSGKVVFDAARFYLPVKQIDLFGQETLLEYDIYGLAPLRSYTAIHGVTLETAAAYDYRTLQPRRLTDPNGNRSEAITDELGMVITTAIMGKPGENVGDTLDGYQRPPLPENADHRTAILAAPLEYLQGASAFFHYDLHAWRRDLQPPYALSVARWEHHADNPDSPVQLAVGYSDGFGRELLTKVQAEPGEALTVDASGQLVTVQANPRWVGNGRTIFNNKGKPVKQYEPYFSPTANYESEAALREFGVTPVLHYDPAGRVVRTDMPDGTFTKVMFTPWEQQSWDQNDTAPESRWYVERDSPDPAGPEPGGSHYDRRAAFWAALHAGTPKTEYLDTLGRVFLMRDHNRNFTPVDVNTTPHTYTSADEYIDSRFELDIEGAQRSVTDALGRLITVNTFNIAGEVVHTHSMDAGQRWMLTNAIGNPLYTWNERGFRTRHVYDALQRPTAMWVSETGGGEACVQLIFYGERADDAAQRNLLGQAHLHYDASGHSIVEGFDFKGNPLKSIKRIAKLYQGISDWAALSGLDIPADLLSQGEAMLESDVFRMETHFDALNRPIQQIAPDGSRTAYVYNEAGLLEKITLTHSRSAQVSEQVQNIDYDAKGQRTRIQYCNGVTTTYEYDPLTFRLTRLRSVRVSDNALLQDLQYHYDPVGNITDQCDEAQQTVFFNNAVVEPHGVYTYDALYRLRSAEGREHIGQNSHANHAAPGAQAVISPQDGSAMRRYIQRFSYDKLGNILQVKHRAGTGQHAYAWTRKYRYDDTSLLRAGDITNRLTATTLDDWATADPYSHDVHGNMTAMSHLPEMQWDYTDQLCQVALQNGGREYYAYATGIKDFGVRSRKVWHKPGGLICDRIYIGEGYEVYRERNAAGDIATERETLHIQDDKGRIALIDTATIENTPIQHPTSTIKHQLTNHLGSACLEVDEAGALISYEEYHAFGTSSYRAGRSAAEVSQKRYRYVGKERDESTGLDYYGARYYAGWLGRWCSADPAGFVDGWNVYRFSNNNQINRIDVNGNKSIYYDEGNHPTETKAEFHIVQKGDTYSSLSEKYNIDVSQLREWNQYDDKKIPIGVKLKIGENKIMIYGSETESNSNNSTTSTQNNTIIVTKSLVDQTLDYLSEQANVVVEYLDNYDFVLEPTVTLSVGLQAGFKTPFGKIGGGVFTSDFAEVKMDITNTDSLKFYSGISDPSHRFKTHNYLEGEVGFSKVKFGEKIGSISPGISGKIDYNFLYYDSGGDYSHIVEGTENTDWNFSFFGKWDKSKLNIVEGVVEPTIKGSVGIEDKDDKNFIGTDISWAAKLLFGIDVKIRIGARQKK
jgi:RHS repeat-associated protein